MKSISKVAKPLIKWLNKNCHPHCKVIVENDKVELVESIVVNLENRPRRITPNILVTSYEHYPIFKKIFESIEGKKK